MTRWKHSASEIARTQAPRRVAQSVLAALAMLGAAGTAQAGEFHRHAIGTPPEGGVAGEVPGLCGDVGLSQSLDALSVLSGIACTDGASSAETGWARAFAIAPGPNFVVNCVDFGVLSSTGPDFVVAVNLLTGTPTDPYGSLTLLASLPVAVPSGTATAVLTADFAAAMGGVTVPAGTTLVVEVLAPTRFPMQGGDGGAFFVGQNSAGQTAPTFIRAADCGEPDFVDMASVGFPDEHLVMRVDGGPIWWTTVEVTNKTGLAAADLELTFAGGGGTLFVPPGLVLAPGCPAPAIPSNSSGPGDTVVIDWGAACVPDGGRVVLVIRSASGPLTFLGGTWSGPGGVIIGPIGPSNINTTLIGVGLPPPKPFIAIKRYIRYTGNPVYGKWTKPPGQCWQRWCCFPAGTLVCQDRFDICFFIDPIFRFLEIGNCRRLAGWRTFFVNPGVVWFLQVTTVKPPPDEPQDPPGGGPPQKPPLFAPGDEMIDRYDLEVLESDDGGLTVDPGTDFADAFFGLFNNLRIVGEDPTLPPILGLPNLLQAMAPSYELAGEGLDEVLVALTDVLGQQPSPQLAAAQSSTMQLKNTLLALSNAYAVGAAGNPLQYTVAANALRNIGEQLFAASGGTPRFWTAREYLFAMAEGMDVSAQMVATGLPTPVEQDAFLWGQIARVQPMAESVGLALLSHVRIPLDLQLQSWGPESGPVQVVLQDASLGDGGGEVLDDGLQRINEFGEILLLNQPDAGEEYLVWTKPPTHLAVSQMVPAIDGFTAPVIALINGDADGNNCVDAADEALVTSELGLGGEFAFFVPSSDVDRDGVVTPDDLLIVMAHLGACGAPYPVPRDPCPADFNDDGTVDGADIGLLLAAWNTPAGDLNGDGVTDGADLGLLLGAFGPCPPG